MKSEAPFTILLIMIILLSFIPHRKSGTIVHRISDLQTIDDEEVQSWTMVHESSFKYSTCKRIKILGGNGVAGKNAYAEKTYYGIPTHNQVHIYFEFFEIDSWDEEIFYFYVDGKNIPQGTTYFYSTSLPNQCGGPTSDEIYFYAYKIKHSSNTLTIKFSSNLNEPASSESWGVRNLQILFYNCEGLDNCFSCVIDPETFPFSCYKNLFKVCPSAASLNVDDESCSFCDITCETCFNGKISGCSSCSSNYLYVESEAKSQKCVDSCPDGLYADNGPPKSCKKCDSSCKTCSGPTQNECSTCPTLGTPYLYNSNQCLNLCPDGTYGDASKICQACDTKCSKCSSSGSNNCQACKSGYYLKDLNCYGPDECKLAFGWPSSSDNSCQNCHYTCLTCIGPNNDDCVSCPASGYPYSYNGNQCLSACPGGTFPDSSKICRENCHARCLKCTGLGYDTCQSCSTGFYLKGSSCLDPIQCTANSGWPESLKNTCSNCHSNCLTCSGPNDNNCRSCSKLNNLYHELPDENIDGRCLKPCISPYLYSHEATRRCYKRCPVPTWAEDSTKYCKDSCPASNYFAKDDGIERRCFPCHSECATCRGPLNDDCMSCSGNLYLYGSKCVVSCGSGKYGQSSDNSCQKCSSNCKECTTPNQPALCSACGGNSFLSSGKCSATCPSNQYKEFQDQTCKNCYSDCSTCYGPNKNQCLSCADPFFHDEDSDMCVRSCSEPKFAYNDGFLRKCYKTCLGSFFAINSTRICSTNCLAANEYKDRSDNICKSCFSNCATCDGFADSNCLTCVGDLYLTADNKCETSCGSGYYAKTLEKKCYPCLSPCKTCISPDQPSKCLSCFKGKYLQGGRCVDFCDPPYFRVNETNICSLTCYADNQYPDPADQLCKPCFKTCRTCKDLTPLGCTSCSPPLFLQGGNCTVGCSQANFFPNSATRKCEPCDSTCKTCIGISSTDCSSCSSPLFLFENKCLPKCQPLYRNPVNQICSSDCASNYFIDRDTYECKPCHKSCSTCFRDGEAGCLSCSAGLVYTKQSFQCTEKCTKGFYQPEERNVCLACDRSCGSCSKNADSCLTCGKDFYPSELSSTICLRCDQNNQFLDPLTKTCRSCKLDFCKKCVSKDACLICEDLYFIITIGDMQLCQKKTLISSSLNIINEPRIFEIEFSHKWDSFLRSINNLSQLTVSEFDSPDFGYLYERIGDKSVRLLLKFKKPIKRGSILKICFNPDEVGDENKLYSFELNCLNVTLSQYEPCPERKKWGREENACIDALGVTPELKKFQNNPENFVLEFDHYLPNVIANIIEANINVTVQDYSGTVNISKSTDQKEKKRVFIDLTYSLSFKEGPVLKVEILQPEIFKYIEDAYFTATQFQTTIPSFQILTTEEKKSIKLVGEANKQGAEAARFALFMQNILNAGSTLALKNLLTIEFIRLLRYIEIDFPGNVVAIFEANFQFLQIIPDFNLDENPADRRPDGNFRKYNVSPYVFNNVGGNLMNLAFFFFISLIFIVIEACLSNNYSFMDSVFQVLRKIFVWNFVLSCTFSNYLSTTLYTGIGLKWYSFETSLGIFNFCMSLFLCITTILVPAIVFLKIHSLRLMRRREYQEFIRKEEEMKSMKSKIESLREFDRKIGTKKTTATETNIRINPKSTLIDLGDLVQDNSEDKTRIEGDLNPENDSKILKKKNHRSFVADFWEVLRSKDPRKIGKERKQTETGIFSKLKKLFKNNKISSPAISSEMKEEYAENLNCNSGDPASMRQNNSPKDEGKVNHKENSKKTSLMRRSLLTLNNTIAKLKRPLLVEEIRQKYAIFMEDFREGSALQEYYFLYDLLRQIYLAFIILTLRNWPIIQSSLSFALNTALFLLLIIKRPFKNSIDQLQMTFNELCLLLGGFSAVHFAILDIIKENDVTHRIKLGWIIVGSSMGLIAGLLLRTIYELFVVIRIAIRRGVAFYKRKKLNHILSFKQKRYREKKKRDRRKIKGK